MVSKGLALRFLTSTKIKLFKGKEKRIADVIAESIAVINGLFCLLTLFAIHEAGKEGIHEAVVKSFFVLNATSIFVLTAFIAIFLSIWPKTRSRERFKEGNYEDPSFLVLALVFTIWNIMMILKIGWLIPGFESILAPDAVWKDHALNILDILNSGFFLLAALQFDFEQTVGESPLKKIVISARKWLNQKSRVTILIIISIGCYAILVLLKTMGWFSGIQEVVRVWTIPIVLLGIFTILVLGTFMEQLYRERTFGKLLRRSVNGLMLVAALLTLSGYFEVSPLPDTVNIIALTCYRVGLAAVFLLLGFSVKDKKENALRLRDVVLSAETQSTHFAQKHLKELITEIENLRSGEMEHPKMLAHLSKTINAILELNKLIFSYRSSNLEKLSFSKNFKELTRQLTNIFYFWGDNETVKTRISVKKIDWAKLEAINFKPKKQLDLLRLITELCLNGNSAYSRNYSATGNIPGEIRITTRAGKDKTSPKLFIYVDNDSPANDEDRKKIDAVFAQLVTPGFLIRKSEQIWEEGQNRKGEQDEQYATSAGLGLYIIKAICQLNGWVVSRCKVSDSLKSGSSKQGVSVQIEIPLN